MNWLVDLLQPEDGQPDRRPIIAGAIALGVVTVGALVFARREPRNEDEAKAAFIKSLRGPAEEREAAKAKWDAFKGESSG